MPRSYLSDAICGADEQKVWCAFPPWLLYDNQTNLCIGWPTREGFQANLFILHIFIHSFRVYSVPGFLDFLVSWFPGFLVPLVPLVSWLNQEFYFNRHERKQFLRRIHLKIYNPSIHLFRIFFCLYSYNLVKLISSNF